MMVKLLGTVIALALVGAGVTGARVSAGIPGQDTQATSPHPAAIPTEAANMPNPVKPTDESIAKAKRFYAMDCAMCHGEDGGGKGEVAVQSKLVIKDFRIPDTLKERKDGELYYIIHNGNDKMPGEGARVKEDTAWNLVIYLRSFSDPSVLPAKK